jgi:beta-N-acetylhexosaminidase
VRLVEELGPGGIILFGFNIPEEARELGPLIGELQDAAGRHVARAERPEGASGQGASSKGPALLIAVDHEGGSVFRFKNGLTRLPAPRVTAKRGKN